MFIKMPLASYQQIYYKWNLHSITSDVFSRYRTIVSPIKWWLGTIVSTFIINGIKQIRRCLKPVHVLPRQMFVLCFRKVKTRKWMTYFFTPFTSFPVPLPAPLLWHRKKYRHICDMIKRNESDVGDIVFEIMAETVFKLFWIIYCFKLDKGLLNSPDIQF